MLFPSKFIFSYDSYCFTSHSVVKRIICPSLHSRLIMSNVAFGMITRISMTLLQIIYAVGILTWMIIYFYIRTQTHKCWRRYMHTNRYMFRNGNRKRGLPLNNRVTFFRNVIYWLILFHSNLIFRYETGPTQQKFSKHCGSWCINTVKWPNGTKVRSCWTLVDWFPWYLLK